jgi:hypothetical protein
MLCGCISFSAKACVTFPMKQCGDGAINFGQSFANGLRPRRPRPGDKWQMGDVFIRIQGVQHYLWRAVDRGGAASPVSKRRASARPVSQQSR